MRSSLSLQPLDTRLHFFIQEAAALKKKKKEAEEKKNAGWFSGWFGSGKKKKEAAKQESGKRGITPSLPLPRGAKFLIVGERSSYGSEKHWVVNSKLST